MQIDRTLGIPNLLDSLAVRLLVVDDHPLVFDALSVILSRLPEHISSEFLPSFGEAVSRTLSPPPIDLVLLDLGLPGFIDIGALIEFRQRCPKTAVAIISATEDPFTIEACFHAGAVGFIPKTFGSVQFRNAIQKILEGERFSPLNAERPEPADPNEAVARRFELTGRQLEVLKVMGQGKSNGAIGQDLGLTVNTVKVHVGAVLDKLGAANRTEAVMIARRHGMPFDD